MVQAKKEKAPESKPGEKEQRAETHGQKAHGEWNHPWAANAGRHWNIWSLPLGLIGPLIGTAIWVVFIIIGLWILKFANAAFQSTFVTLLINAVAANLQWFLVVSLAIGYIDFFSRKFQPAGLWLFPLSNAIGATFSAWIVAWIFRTIGTLAGVPVLTDIGVLIRANLLIVFAVFLALGALMVEGRRVIWRNLNG